MCTNISALPWIRCKPATTNQHSPPLDKAILMNPKDGQTRDTICICLTNVAKDSMRKEDYTTAIKLLTKAKDLVSKSESTKIKDLVLRNLQIAHLRSGNLKEVEDLEKQHGQTVGRNNAATSINTD